jgi:hypothetical protein
VVLKTQRREPSARRRSHLRGRAITALASVTLATSLALLLTIVLGVHVSGSGGNTANGDALQALDFEARIDPGRGTIRLPLDHFLPNFYEMHEIDFAWNLLMRKCMNANGLQYQFVDLRDIPEPVSRRYGIWIVSEAKRYGYSSPPPDAATEAALRLNAKDYSADYRTELQACARSRNLRPLQIEPSSARSIQTYEQTLVTHEAASVIASWRSCLAGKGVIANQSGPLRWIPVGVDPSISNATSIATHDAECKATVGLVSKLAAVESVIQRSYINANEAAYLRQWKAKNEAIRYARSVTGSP